MKYQTVALQFTALLLITSFLVLLPSSACAAAEAEPTAPAHYFSLEDNAPIDEGEVSDWNQIIAIAVGNGFSIGLREDGHVAFAGDYDSEAINRVSTWDNVKRIEVVTVENHDENCTGSYIVGYRKDGDIALTYISGSDGDDDLISDQEPWTEEELAGWSGIEQVILTYDVIVGRKTDGSVLWRSKIEEEALKVMDSWTSIIQIMEASGIIFGLKDNGTVVATGELDNGSAIKPEEWKNVNQLCKYYDGQDRLCGIQSDGTFVGLDNGEWELSPWNMELTRDIAKAIFCYGESADCFVLTQDGHVTLKTTDGTSFYHYRGQFGEVRTWTDIIQLEVKYETFWNTIVPPIGLRGDGSVVSVYYDSERVVDDWTDVQKLYCGLNYTIGLREDGTVLVTGGISTDPALKELESWTNIKEVVIAEDRDHSGTHYLGLKTDGTVVSAGDNSKGQCDVNESRISDYSDEGTGEISWKLNKQGVLTISGTGRMNDYEFDYINSSSNAPWYDMRLDIKEVRISEGITGIGSYSFYGFEHLKKAVVPKSVEFIGEGAFQNCESLTRIKLWENVKIIHSDAFDGCTAIKSAGPIGSGSDYEFGWTERIPDHAFCGTGIENVDIPETICSIGNAAFQRCYSLKKIVLPDKIKRIGVGTFAGCSSLKKITIPGNIEIIGHFAFQFCNSLEEVCFSKVQSNLKFIQDYAFRDCNSLTEIDLPDGLQEIGEWTFLDCTELNRVSLPSSVVPFLMKTFEMHEEMQEMYEELSEKTYDDKETITAQDIKDFTYDYLFGEGNQPDLVFR